jgi:hypothetical protein
MKIDCEAFNGPDIPIMTAIGSPKLWNRFEALICARERESGRKAAVRATQWKPWQAKLWFRVNSEAFAPRSPASAGAIVGPFSADRFFLCRFQGETGTIKNLSVCAALRARKPRRTSS